MDIISTVFAHAVALSALAVVIVQQILKLNLVPLAFANRYPVLANIVLSIGASIFVVLRGTLHAPVAWTDWVILIATTSVIAALTYNNTLHNWDQLRQLEGEGKVAPRLR